MRTAPSARRHLAGSSNRIVGRLTFERGFTLLELVVVITIFAVITTIVGLRGGSFTFLNEETTLRRLSETISFLHYQALADQRMYQLEIDLGDNSYKVGQLTDVGPPDPEVAKIFQDAGVLSLELALMLNPSVSSDQIFSDPESFPSLGESQRLPDGMVFTDVRTMRGVIHPPDAGMSASRKDDPERPGMAYIRFSPRGFSEFSVIHMKLASGKEITILVNPFSGSAEIIRQYKDFEWTYGRNRKKDNEKPRGFG